MWATHTLLLLLLFQCHRAVFRYSQVNQQLLGPINNDAIKSVDSEQDCAKVGLEANALGLLVSQKSDGKWECVPMDVTGFDELNDSKERFFMADFRDEDTCSGGQKSVAELFSDDTKCHISKSICQAMRNLKSYCTSYYSSNLSNCRKPGCENDYALSADKCCPRDFTYLKEFEPDQAHQCIGMFPIDNVKTKYDCWKICEDRKSMPISISNDEQNDALEKLANGNYVVIGLSPPHQDTECTEKSYTWFYNSTTPTYRKWASRIFQSGVEECAMVLIMGGEWELMKAEEFGEMNGFYVGCSTGTGKAL